MGLLLAGLPPARAAETVFAKVASISGDDWTVAGLEAFVDLGSRTLSGEVSIRTITLPAAGLSLADTRVRCERLELTPNELACEDAAFSAELPGIGRREFPGAVRYDRRTGAVAFDLPRIPLAGSTLSVSGSASGTASDFDFAGEALAIPELVTLAGNFGFSLDGWSAEGTVDLSGGIRIRAAALGHLEVDAVFRDTSVSNETGTIVTASATGRAGLEATRVSAGWDFSGELAGERGEAYFEPVYADLADSPVQVAAAGSVDGALSRIDLERYAVTLGSEVEASGRLSIVLPEQDEQSPALSGSVALVNASFETLYSSLLQVFAAGTLFGDLETAGTVSGSITFEGNAPTSADLVLEDVIADDRQTRFAVYGLGGEIHWPGPGGEPGDAPASHLAWDGARAYDIPVGAARIDASLGGDDVELEAPLEIPTMGGALRVNRFAIGNFGASDATGLLDAELEPIQLGLLTAAFGWPAFSGTLSGRLPLLQYDGEVVTVGGTLTARAFGGDIELANLRLEQPFGLVPRLYGDLSLRRLELEQVTNTFSFGLIQGRLSGDVTGLEMIEWQPVAMDMHLYTPREDPGRRRISQRAVENLASVGGSGGAAVALSSGFMSLFEVFAYREIGLRCVLKDGVCRMSGAGPARASQLGQGYYIVEGSGLPRIDVVGYRREVDWSQLVRQLIRVTESGAPALR